MHARLPTCIQQARTETEAEFRRGNDPVLQPIRQIGTLSRTDPFGSYAGHDGSAVCQKAIEFGTSTIRVCS
jgi:hypothetical protein